MLETYLRELTLPQACAWWLVISFIWGKISIALKMGKKYGEIKTAEWKKSGWFAFFNSIFAMAVVIGTGFFREIHFPQGLYIVSWFLGNFLVQAVLPAIRVGAGNEMRIEYNFMLFFADLAAIAILYFGHAYGPLGLNPWPA